MSKRIEMPYGQSPIERPELWTTIPATEVKVGDVFQGRKNPRKWYENNDLRQVDPQYKYWRRKPALTSPATTQAEPGAAGAATAAAPAEVKDTKATEVEDNTMIVVLGVKVTKEAFTRMIGTMIEDGDIEIVAVGEPLDE